MARGSGWIGTYFSKGIFFGVAGGGGGMSFSWWIGAENARTS
jgi:hypothetical protein